MGEQHGTMAFSECLWQGIMDQLKYKNLIIAINEKVNAKGDRGSGEIPGIGNFLEVFSGNAGK